MHSSARCTLSRLSGTPFCRGGRKGSRVIHTNTVSPCMQKHVQTCRFYNSKQELEAAAALHSHPVLAPLMPAMLYRHADATIALPNATVPAPCLAMQQGLTLCKWYGQPRRLQEVRDMVVTMASHLAKLHAAGFVHGSLRADQVLYMRWDSGDWRILGLAKVVREGASAAETEPLLHALAHVSCAGLQEFRLRRWCLEPVR